MQNLQKDILYIKHNLDMLLKYSETFSDNETKYIIRNGLLYLLPYKDINLHLNYSKKELIRLAYKVRALIMCKNFEAQVYDTPDDVSIVYEDTPFKNKEPLCFEHKIAHKMAFLHT